MVSGTDHETVLNSRLADLLRDAGLDAKAENRQPGSTKQIDVDVNLGSYRVALEAEIDNPKGAWQDAEKRRGEAEAGLVVADRVIAVNYPAGLQASNFTAGTSIELAVLPSKDFFPAPVAALAGVVRRSHPISNNPDSIAKDLDDVLTAAIERLSTSQRAPAQNAAWTESVKFVANRALAVARDAASARHDLMGRIFHRLVDTARYDGSYYTSRNGRGVCTPRNRAASTCRRGSSGH